MKTNISSVILTEKYKNRLSVLPKSISLSKKMLKLQANKLKKLKNKPSNFLHINNNYLPDINLFEGKVTKRSEEKKESQKLKNSFSSTFYTTNGNKKNIFSDDSKKKGPINNIKNYNQFSIIRAKSYSKFKQNLEINPNYLEIKNSKKNKYNGNENIDLYIDEDINEQLNTKDNDFSLVIKKLDRWDKDNCFVKQYDQFSLYKILNNYYQKKGLKEDLYNLNTMDSLLKSKINYDNVIQNRLNYKTNKVVTDIFNSPKKENNQKLNKIRYSISKFNLPKNTKNNEKDNNEDTKLLTEKLKYENQLHHDLVFVNNIIYNKKCLKREKLRKLEEIYKKKSDLKHEYDRKYNYHMKNYWYKYDEYEQRYKRLEEMIIQQSKKEKLEKKENKEEKYENNKDKENEKNNNKEKNKNQKENNENDWDDYVNDNNKKDKKEENSKSEEAKIKEEDIESTFNANNIQKPIINVEKFIKEMNFIKNTKLNSIKLELNKNMEKLGSEYKGKFKEVNKQKKEMEEQIAIINNELNYYKQVNEELIREHRTYYMGILKKGMDYRKEGLVWIVKNLLELQINLEYQHFPKYLTHEHIDYLLKLANLLLEQSELIIIIKVLRKKQTTSYMDDNIQTYNMLDKFMKDRLKEKNNKNNNLLLGDTQNKIDMNYGKSMENIVREIDKKFYKVYQNNKEIMKNYLEKNEEEVKLRNAMAHIKKGLYNIDNFVKDNQASILDAFMCNTKNKDFFSFILKIKNRLNQLDTIIDNLIKNQKDFYLEQIKKINNSETKNFDNNFNKDIIKKSLFGEKCDF